MKLNNIISFTAFILAFTLPLLLINRIIPVTAVNTLSATVTLSRPNGGEILRVGDIFRITWISSKEINKVSLINVSGLNSSTSIVTAIPNVNYYDWKVSVGSTNSSQYKIKIIATGVGVSAIDMSDAFFTILLPTTTPTPTRKPTPTPTRKPTPTPTRKPTPTPTSANQPPVILDAGKNFQAEYLQSYLYKSITTDANMDKISMTISGLPKGLSYKCVSVAGKTTCTIQGKPTILGTFYLTYTATDEHQARKIANSTLEVIRSVRPRK